VKVVIAGAGIAGLTLAYWLHEYGCDVTIIEKAHALDRNGFLLGIRGASITVLEKMKLLNKALSLAMDSILHDVLSSTGKRINRSLYLSYKEDVRGKLPMNRADLHAILYEAVKDKVEIRFGTCIESVEQQPNHVEIRLSNGQYKTADLLVGADGIHSQVRQLAFGEGFEHSLDASYAAFVSPKISPIQSAVQFAARRMSVIYDLNATEFGGIFILKGDDFANLPPLEQKTELIRLHDSPIADALATISDDTYIFVDRLTQIIMPQWYDGRVVLVGDAAYGLSPASGFGATAAICGAYVLAEEIHKYGFAGLQSYEARMRPTIEKKRKSSSGVVKHIVTENRVMMTIRDVLLRLMPEKASYKAQKVSDFGIQD
jgi:2-polyprenyl-6-methoxyphenol hydroxylase-like FAD-dependent oxidoreductase